MKSEIRNGRLKAMLQGALLVAIFIGFQNCGQPSPNTSTLPSGKDVSGNGQGYGGKATYVNHTQQDQLCPDGTDIKAKILVESTTNAATLVRENCVDREPAKLDQAQVDLRAYNPDNLIYRDSVFDITSNDPRLTNDGPGFSARLCRGSATDAATSQVTTGDAIIYATAGGFQGRYVLGIYSSAGALLEKKDSGLVAVAGYTDTVHESYASKIFDPAVGQKVFSLEVDVATMTGTLNYTTLLFSSVTNSYENTVSGMKCYTQ